MIIIVVIIIFIRIISTVIRIRMMNIRVFHKNTFFGNCYCAVMILSPETKWGILEKIIQNAVLIC